MSENNHEKTFEEVAKGHPDFPRIIMRKIDTALRGVTLTGRALERAKEEGALYDVSADLGLKTPRLVLGGALFRDGTVVLGLEDMYLQFPEKFIRRGSSYTLDAVDGRLWLLDGKERVEVRGAHVIWHAHFKKPCLYCVKQQRKRIGRRQNERMHFAHGIGISYCHLRRTLQRRDALLTWNIFQHAAGKRHKQNRCS